ncbi:hypothetical protein F4677DRAFT_448350 [Hypoxylon crocopeplum]|nr:hypothetical protein F4677DRAFT_448350 [Hypoxylon crocopeplum]
MWDLLLVPLLAPDLPVIIMLLAVPSILILITEIPYMFRLLRLQIMLFGLDNSYTIVGVGFVILYFLQMAILVGCAILWAFFLFAVGALFIDHYWHLVTFVAVVGDLGLLLFTVTYGPAFVAGMTSPFKSVAREYRWMRLKRDIFSPGRWPEGPVAKMIIDVVDRFHFYTAGNWRDLLIEEYLERSGRLLTYPELMVNWTRDDVPNYDEFN